MKKNFNLTEEEKRQILEMHQSYGYKKPVNEGFTFGRHSELDEKEPLMDFLKDNNFYFMGTQGEHVEIYMNDGLGIKIYYEIDAPKASQVTFHNNNVFKDDIVYVKDIFPIEW